MKFVSCLAFLAIVLSSRQAVGDDFGKQSHVRGVSGSTSETQPTTLDQDHRDQEVIRRKMPGKDDDGSINLGGSAKGNPCKDTTTFAAALAKLAGQCTDATTAYTTSLAAYTTQLQNCAAVYPYGGDTSPSSGAFGVSISGAINTFCAGLLQDDANALNLSKSLLNLKAAVTYANAQQTNVNTQIAALIASCSVSGLQPPVGSATSCTVSSPGTLTATCSN